MRSRLLVLSLAMGALAAPGLASATMFGVGFDRTLYLIDETDGSGSAIGSVAGSAAVNAAATDSNGVSYTAVRLVVRYLIVTTHLLVSSNLGRRF